MKVEKKQNASTFLATYWRELMIKIWRLGKGKEKGRQNLANLDFFYMKNLVYRSKSYFSGRNSAKIC